MTRRHLFAWVVLVAVLTAGCGVRPSGVITGDPAPTVQALGRPGAPSSGGPVESAVLYFLAGSTLTPARRQTSGHLSPTQALALLQHGPDGDEPAANLTTEVPTGLDPVTVTTTASGTVDVVVSADVTALSSTAVDQIVCTVGRALPTTAPITLSSPAATRKPRTCPLTG
jgi:hypothetical protein